MLQVCASERLFADWWSRMSKTRQESYIKRHPRSKKAKQAHETQKSADTKLSETSVGPTSVRPIAGAAVHKTIKNKFNNAEIKSIADYSSDATDPKNNRFKPMYQAINQGLRNGAELDSKTKATIKALDKTFADAHTTEPIEVYKGLENAFADKLEPGMTFEDNGFASTSSDPKTAKSFSGSKGTILKISVPKGSKALSIAGQSEYPDEQEVLLNRGGTYKVTDVTTDANGVKTIHVEYS